MDDPNMHAYGEDGPTDAEIGRQWRENSSLEKWFPITAERLAALEAENAALKRDLEYARSGLTKGRSRMREDIARLQAALDQKHAEYEDLKACAANNARNLARQGQSELTGLLGGPARSEKE